jgi:hypothetical protein
METLFLERIEDKEFLMKRRQSLFQDQMFTNKIIREFRNLQQSLVLDLVSKGHKQARVMLALLGQEHIKSDN